MAWIIGIAIRAAQPPTDTSPAARDAGRRAEKILQSKGWDKKLHQADDNTSSPDQASQSSEK